jgi:hypothetical protein
MEPFPLLRTQRLVLREFTLEDAPELGQIAQVWEVAHTMLHLPHPYDEGVAQESIAGLRSEQAKTPPHLCRKFLMVKLAPALTPTRRHTHPLSRCPYPSVGGARTRVSV